MKRRVDWVIGILGGIIGVGFIALQLWLAGMIVLGIGMVVIRVAAGKIR